MTVAVPTQLLHYFSVQVTLVLYCAVLYCTVLYLYEVEPDSDEDAGYDGDLYSDTDSEAADTVEEERWADCGCDGRGGTDSTREQEVAVSG